MTNKYFAYDYDDGITFFDTAEAAKNHAQRFLDGYAEDSSEGWDEGVEQIVWGEIKGSIVAEELGKIEHFGELVDGVNYHLIDCDKQAAK